MKLTPLDIRQKQFKTGFRGLDPKDVEAFLDLVASEFEELAKENLFIKDEDRGRRSRFDEYRDREKTLQETMVAAQKVAEDMKEAAKKQAEIVVSEAELQAEKIVQNAHQRLVEIVSEIQRAQAPAHPVREPGALRHRQPPEAPGDVLEPGKGRGQRGLLREEVSPRRNPQTHS